MLKCWDFLPASLTPAFNDLSSIHSTLSPKVLSTYHFHSSLFYVLIQICTVSIKYLTLQTLWPLPFLKTRLLYWLYSNKLIFLIKICPNISSVVLAQLFEDIFVKPGSLWHHPYLFHACHPPSQDGSFGSMSAKSKGRRLGKIEWQSAKGKEKTLDRSVPSNTVYIWFIRNEGNGSTWQQSSWKEFCN